MVRRTQVRRTTENAAEQQDPIDVSSLCHSNRFAVWPFINTPYLDQNQNVNSRGEAATIVQDDEGSPQEAVSANIFLPRTITKISS